MSQPAIAVRGLWKEYTVGQNASPATTFYETLSNTLSAPFRKREPQAESSAFWALRDVNFEVQPGEVVGVIGRNGAGKSTLLKILSRITAPTKGHIEVRGRLASLLEVGTGFHPELSGRENIFLNGAILGMTRREIAKKFDEIVAFAEVDKFIDTPVKRYSSGMYVRLAFAVAAHLEPEVLIVDEVLAVGDLAFQRKCLGKMQSVAELGRTVLFVSHNMAAVKLLCHRVFALQDGRLVDSGASGIVVSGYAAHAYGRASRKWVGQIDSDHVLLQRVELVLDNGDGAEQPAYVSTVNRTIIEIELTVLKRMEFLCVGFDLLDGDGACILRSYQTDRKHTMNSVTSAGRYVLRCEIPSGVLNAGRYGVAPRVGIHNVGWMIHADSLVSFECEMTHGETEYWVSLTNGGRPGVISPLLEWSVCCCHEEGRQRSRLVV